jgi:hypothetical protein
MPKFLGCFLVVTFALFNAFFKILQFDNIMAGFNNLSTDAIVNCF